MSSFFYASMFKIHSVIQILAVFFFFCNDGVILDLISCSCCSKKKNKKQWETLLTDHPLLILVREIIQIFTLGPKRNYWTVYYSFIWIWLRKKLKGRILTVSMISKTTKFNVCFTVSKIWKTTQNLKFVSQTQYFQVLYKFI